LQLTRNEDKDVEFAVGVLQRSVEFVLLARISLNLEGKEHDDNAANKGGVKK